MLFNSIDFAIFLPIVFILYWWYFYKGTDRRNIFLIIVSYIFYGWWDWRFLSLIIISSFVDYFVGLNLGKTEDRRKRKMWLLVSLTVNLGFLGFFKYFNFFVDNFYQAFTFFGYHFHKPTLRVVLPVGISFYTFQTMSYSIDVYRKQIEPTKDLWAFFAYVSFFPQLVAGPIERAKNFMPQFFTPKKFSYEKGVEGLRQILWGFFKKMVIADNAAIYVNDIFANYTHYSGSTLLIGAIFFAFQIYGDFSGYSDIAIGTAKLFDFKLMRNFAYPYFSRDIAEFWRRWHISLSSWFKDYVYIPLGGSRVSLPKRIRNTFIIFVVSGFWHGANWTFIIWGALNAAYYLPLMLTHKNRKYLDIVAKGRLLPTPKEMWQMGVTFFITVLAWIFFRSETAGKAVYIIRKILSPSLFTMPKIDFKYNLLGSLSPYMVSALIVFMLIVEWLQRDKQHGLEFTQKTPAYVRWTAYIVVSMIILVLGNFHKTEFIYFAF